MKKLSLLLVLVMVLGMLSGFAMAEDKIRVAFVPQLIGIPYFTAMEEGGNEAAEVFDVDFMYVGATTASASEQSRLVDSLIKQQVEAISVATLDSASLNPILEKGKAAGLKMFTSDSDSADSCREVFVCQALDDALGYTMIDCLVADIKNNIGGDGVIQIGIVSGEATATNLNSWISYMQENIDKNYAGEVEIVDVRFTQGGSSEDSLKQAQELLIKYPDLKGLVAVASSCIPGVCQAVEQAGKIGEVFVSCYGSPLTIQPYIEKGIMKTSVIWDAKALGYLTVWAGYMLANNMPFEAENTVEGMDAPVRYFEDTGILLLGDPLIVTPDNIENYLYF